MIEACGIQSLMLAPPGLMLAPPGLMLALPGLMLAPLAKPHTSQLASHVDRLHTQGMESVGNGRSTRADLGHTSTHNNT